MNYSIGISLYFIQVLVLKSYTNLNSNNTMRKILKSIMLGELQSKSS